MNCHRVYSLHRGPDGYHVAVSGRAQDDGVNREPAARQVAPPAKPAPKPAAKPQPLMQVGPLDC